MNCKDVDVVVLRPECPQEELKRRIVQYDSRFFLVNAKNPRDSYKVLWYRLDTYGTFRRCKVDVLQSGVMDIPEIDKSNIEIIRGLPIMPFSIVLLLKLLAWSDHRVASKLYLRQKQHTDAMDIKCLLPLAAAKGVSASDSVIPDSLLKASKAPIRMFDALAKTDTRSGWQSLGFLEVETSSENSESVRVTPAPASKSGLDASASVRSSLDRIRIASYSSSMQSYSSIRRVSKDPTEHTSALGG